MSPTRMVSWLAGTAIALSVALVGTNADTAGREHSLGSTATVAQAVMPVEVSEFYIAPQVIVVPAGSVTFTIVNTGFRNHDFTIIGENVLMGAEIIGSGEVVTFSISMLPPGTYVTVCTVGDHQSRGQIGTLIVE